MCSPSPLYLPPTLCDVIGELSTEALSAKGMVIRYTGTWYFEVLPN